MKSLVKLSALLFVIGCLVCFGLASDAMAKGDKGTKAVMKAPINYPANVVNETAKVGVKTTKGAAGAVADTAKAIGDTVTGQPKRAPEIITIPVVKTAETTKDTVIGTVSVPVEAGKATAEQGEK